MEDIMGDVCLFLKPLLFVTYPDGIILLNWAATGTPDPLYLKSSRTTFFLGNSIWFHSR